MKILIVDDKAENLYMLEALLKGNGYEVVSAANGAEALEKLRTETVGMIISDILMPVMDGFQLCQEVRADETLKYIPLIFYTATYTDEADEGLILRIGADKFLRKPIEPDELIKIIQGVIRDAEEGKLRPQEPALGKTEETFELYSERLVKKLEKKMLDLEKEITERERAEERVKHINLVLVTIRMVNQLIVHEKDTDRLLQGVCDNLIENRGYYNAWIALLDDTGGLVPTAEAGLGKDFLPIVERLKKGKMIDCVKKAQMQSGIVVTKDPPSTCSDCPSAKRYRDRGGFTARLEHDGEMYGLLTVSIPGEFVADEEEQSLFGDVAGDIGYALNNIELEKEHKQAEEALREARRREAEGRLARELAATAAIVNDMFHGEVDDAETERRVLDACLAATDSVYGMIGVINEHGKYEDTCFSSQTIHDCAFPEALSWKMSTGMTIRGIWGWPMLHGEPLLCNDLEAHPDWLDHPHGHVPIDCFLGVPLKREGDVVGMLAVANKPGGYTDVDRDTLIRLASVMSVSRQHRVTLIEARRTHAELEGLVRKRTDELQKIVNLMAGREIRMAELKKVIKKLHVQLEEAGMTPVADDPLKETGKDYT
jgi:CheY-like chemotaxis protein/GAF domain-containing protein